MDFHANDAYNEPTLPRFPDAQPPTTPGKFAGPPASTQAAATTTPSVASPSRRRFMGQSLTRLAVIGGVGAASVAGGVALDRWLQNGGISSMIQPQPHGPMASETQIGHLLRRAGFGASPADLATYRALGFTGAVDQLLNYSQVSDSAMESRLNALNLDLNLPQDQQRWWLLRMAWTQRPLLEKMTLFWHGVLTSSFRKVGGKLGYMRMIIQNNFLRAHAFDTFDNILLG
ncbi:MAG TPA: DUF1800 family protein, partial [Ktedonobacteraceae bacterium]|nr:DUF1800 family protein [Ktedonobacteraceae bacterium]